MLNGLTPAFPVEDGICDVLYPAGVGNEGQVTSHTHPAQDQEWHQHSL